MHNLQSRSHGCHLSHFISAHSAASLHFARRSEVCGFYVLQSTHHAVSLPFPLFAPPLCSGCFDLLTLFVSSILHIFATPYNLSIFSPRFIVTGSCVCEIMYRKPFSEYGMFQRHCEPVQNLTAVLGEGDYQPSCANNYLLTSTFNLAFIYQVHHVMHSTRWWLPMLQ